MFPSEVERAENDLESLRGERLFYLDQAMNEGLSARRRKYAVDRSLALEKQIERFAAGVAQRKQDGAAIRPLAMAG